MISETKTDEAFPESQFIIEVFSEPYRLYCTVNGRGILLYLREDVLPNASKRLQSVRSDKIRAELNNQILKCDLNNMEYQHFLNLFTEILSKHAPLKKKYLRANQGRLMTKDLHKAKMNRSRFYNKFLRNKTKFLRKEYRKQQDFVVISCEKPKKMILQNLIYLLSLTTNFSGKP